MTLNEFLDNFHNTRAGDSVAYDEFAQMAIDQLTDTTENETSLALYEAARNYLLSKDKFQQVMHEVEVDLD